MRWVVAFLACTGVGVVACGGSTAPLTDPGSSGGSSSGSGGSSGGIGGSSSSGGVPTGEVPVKHRPAAVACPSQSSAGVPCNTDAECNATSPGTAPTNFCRHGLCGPDQCNVDDDCGTNGVCSCIGSTYGYAHVSAGNVCVAADCRVDADCGPGGWCSPTVSSECGSFYGVQGYYCHRPGDACVNDGDCPAAAGSPSITPYCAYDTSVGRWACGNSLCAG
jgi:hypothetical protein